MNIQELCERYGLKTRQSIYERINQLGITLAKKGNKSYATPEQVELLDQLNEYMGAGGTLKTFVPTIVTTPEIDTVSVEVDSYLDTVSPEINSLLEPSQVDGLVRLIEAISAINHKVSNPETKPDALAHYRQLEEAIAHNWILTTSEIEELLGVKPKGETFTRGCWLFTKAGKVGIQNGWSVSKI
jgi:hypothetical protein